MMNSKYFRICADIDLDAVKTNIINIKKRLKEGTKVCCVVKADAYGHGALKVAGALKGLADFFAVATLEEALSLRAGKVKEPVLILGYIHPDGFKEAILNNISLTVFDLESAEILSKTASDLGLKAKVHIKIDTGMSRIGFLPNSESLEYIKKISSLCGIKIEGIFTHLYASDEYDKTSAYGQVSLFDGFCSELGENGVFAEIVHCSNSAAALSMPEANMDMVRIGIAMYGLYPSEAVHEEQLFPALSLKSHVVMIKNVPAGTTIGYGATFKASRKMKIATIPAGYADGYMRTLSNKGYVLINGQRAPVVGRVCMDQIMTDVSNISGVQRGSEAVLIGKSAGEQITMEEIAALSGSFNYEFACRISSRVPRRYISGGRYEDDRDDCC